MSKPELICKLSSEDAVAFIERFAVDFSNNLPNDADPRNFLALPIEDHTMTSYLSTLDERPDGRFLLEITANFPMEAHEMDEARKNMAGKKAQLLNHPDISLALNPETSTNFRKYSSIGTIEVIRINEQIARIINNMNEQGSRLWHELESALKEYRALYREINLIGQITKNNQTKQRKGRSELSEDEIIYRLAKAQEGEELKMKDPEMTWKEIVKKVDWNRGSTKLSRYKLYEDARYRLKRVISSDNKELLNKIRQFRAKEKKKN